MRQNNSVDALERLIHHMADDYGEAIAAVYGRTIEEREADAIAFLAATALSSAVKTRSKEIDVAGREQLVKWSRKAE